MKCKKCNKEKYGLFLAFNYPDNKDMVICQICFNKYLLLLKQSFWKFFQPFFDWLLLNQKEISEFQESNQKTESNRNAGTD
jgi:hypothetical protein